MKQMRQVVKNTNNRPVRRPMADRDQRGERQQRQVAERARAAVRDPSACDHWRRRLLSSFGPRASAPDASDSGRLCWLCTSGQHAQLHHNTECCVLGALSFYARSFTPFPAPRSNLSLKGHSAVHPEVPVMRTLQLFGSRIGRTSIGRQRTF